MVNEYSQSLKEVYEIIKNSDNEVTKKIPYRFRKYIYKNMDVNYAVDIDYGKSLINQEHIHEKTRDILALIYRDYLVDSNEKKKLINEEIEIAKKIEEEKLKKYNNDELFKKRQNYQNKHIEKTQIILKENSFFERIIIILKKFKKKGE